MKFKTKPWFLGDGRGRGSIPRVVCFCKYNMFRLLCVLVALFWAATEAKIFFQENFNDDSWSSRWVVPTEWKDASELGAWSRTHGRNYGDASDTGVQTTQDAKHYGISTEMAETFTNGDGDLVVQFSVKYETEPDCGGAYIKLLGAMDSAKFGGDTPYQIMFGPDVCGPSNRKTHVIFNYPPKNDNLLIKNEVKVETDGLTHMYSLVVHKDATFEVFIDLKSVRTGSLEEGWDFLQAKEINDPSVSKPSDWVNDKRIADPEDTKPDGYDDIPETIPDSEAAKPDDWDDEEDGEYEAPMIPNPDYKGPWRAKMIENPDYKGEWEHPKIANPDFAEDPNLHVRCKDCKHVGFELWQVKSGTIFDDILIGDDWEEAKAAAEATWGAKRAGEKAMLDAETAKKEEEAEARRAEAAAAGDEEEEEGEYDDEEEHDEL
jgi:calreticulin